MTDKTSLKTPPQKDNVKQIKAFLVANVVPLLFTVVCIIGIYYSGSSMPIILMDMVTRFSRNGVLVLSLIIPILSGMGLNFGIVLGAMAGQIGLFVVTVLGINGIAGILAAAVITVPLALLFGVMTGKLLNKTKGQEMITSMILGFFANGVFQFLFLYVLGGVIKIDAQGVMMNNGVGVRNTVDLAGIKYALDNLEIFGISTKVDMFTAIGIFGLIFTAANAYKFFVKKKTDNKTKIYMGLSVAASVLGFALVNVPALKIYKNLVKVPMVPYLMIAGLAMLIPAFLGTKLGQDMRAVGQHMGVASVAGINVNKTRITAICISTVLAGWGQIMFLQNMGNMATYKAHENVGMFSAAAILIGGATVAKATVGQALLGTVLFHLLFNVSPMAGKNLFGSAEIGEYFRVFIAYGIIAVALVLYAWKQGVQAKNRRKEE